jgi:hypothetical protein
VLWQQEHSNVFRAYPLAIGTIATTALALLHTMQPASPFIDYPPKLTNAIRIAEVTSDSESRANRNVPEVVTARAQQLDRTPAADAVEPGGTLWDCDELTRAGVKWRTVVLKRRSYASVVRNRQRRRRP